MKPVDSEIIDGLYLSNLLWTLALILWAFHVLCGFRWPQRATCNIQHHWMVPFSICHAVVLFTSSCQMGIIMNVFIANVTKPNTTRLGMKWITEVSPQRGWKWALLSVWGHLTGAYFCQHRITSKLLMQNSGPAITGNSGCSEWLQFSPFKRMMHISEPVMLILSCVNESLFAHLKCTSLGPSLVVLTLKSVWDVGAGEFIHHPPNALLPSGKPTFGGILASVCVLCFPSFPPSLVYLCLNCPQGRVQLA